jgi:hypothetical protein
VCWGAYPMHHPTGVNPEEFELTRGELLTDSGFGGFEIRSLSRSLAATWRGFTFYVADPISSIETQSPPSLTHELPLISTCRFSHLCRAPPRGFIPLLLPSQLCLLSRKLLSSISAST